MKQNPPPRIDPYRYAEEKPYGAKMVNAKKPRPAMGEIGGTGTQDSFGIISDDKNSQFHTGSDMRIYEEMKRTDPMIRATMEALRRPILAAGYTVNPASDDPTDQEIAKFVDKSLDGMETPFDQLLEEILDYPFQGFRYYEKVFCVKEGMVAWEKWASRQPSAHHRWEMSNGEKGVQQILTGTKENKTYADIPWDKLILFTYQRTGSNYGGFPLLRTVFRNWESKDLLYRIQLISMERAAGVIKIKLPKGATQQDKEDAEELGENFRINEQTYLVITEGWEVEMMTNGISEKTARIEPEIEHHNRMMALNILAQFITLTSGDGGSNALSRDQSSFFTLGLRAIAKQVSYVVNQAIKELVIMNWGEREKYPELHFNKIGQVDYAETATALTSLAGAGLIEVTPQVKQTVHSMFDLPEFDIETVEEPEDVPEEIPEEEEMPEEEAEEMTPEQEAEADAMLEELDALEGMLSETMLLARAPMTEETKKKISEALKKGGSPDDEDKYVKNFSKAIANVKAGISQIRDQIKAMREGSKTMDKATKAKVKEQIKLMRDQVKGMMEKKKAVQEKLGARKAILRLERATAKANLKMQKLQDKRKELMGKIKGEKSADAQQKLKDRLAALDEDVSETDTVIKDLLRTSKSVGLSESEEQEVEWKLGEAFDCAHGLRLAEYKAFRDLTNAEKRVKFASVNDYFNASEARVVSLLASFSETQREDIIRAVTRAVEDKDIRGLKELAWKRSEGLKRDLRKEAVNALEFGKSQAAGEIGVSAPSTPNVNTQILDTQVDQLVEERNVKLMGDIKSITMAGIAAGAGLATILYSVKDAFDSAVNTYNKSISGYIAGTAMNSGRNLVFWENEEKIHGIQRSEILDGTTCAMCMSLDGRVMDVNDPFANLEEVHTNCRGINVAILKNDEDLPTVTGIPGSILNKFDTIEGVPVANSFQQLKAPSYTKGSRLQQKIDDGKMEDNPLLS